MQTQHDLARLHDVLSTAMLVLDGDARCQAATCDTSDGAVKIVRSVTGGGLPPCIPIENQPPPLRHDPTQRASFKASVEGRKLGLLILLTKV